MRLNKLLKEITRPANYDIAADRLSRSGYTTMGSGSYAQVMGKPNSEYVVKLFTSKDRGSLTFLKLIMAHPSIHFPKVFGKPVLVKPGYYGVRIERLTPLDDKNIDLVFQDVWPFEANIRHNPGKIYRFDQEHPELAKALRLIDDMIRSNNGIMLPDLSVENIMQRGSTLVITDPVN